MGRATPRLLHSPADMEPSHTNIWNRHLGSGVRGNAIGSTLGLLGRMQPSPGSPLLPSAVNVAVRVAGRDQSKFGFLRVAIERGRQAGHRRAPRRTASLNTLTTRVQTRARELRSSCCLRSSQLSCAGVRAKRSPRCSQLAIASLPTSIYDAGSVQPLSAYPAAATNSSIPYPGVVVAIQRRAAPGKAPVRGRCSRR